MGALVLGSMAQIITWFWLFYALDEFEHFSESTYHSAVNYATLGYADIVISEKHRLLGRLEASNGAMMIVVSAALLMATAQDVFRKTMEISGPGPRPCHPGSR